MYAFWLILMYEVIGDGKRQRLTLEKYRQGGECELKVCVCGCVCMSVREERG